MKSKEEEIDVFESIKKKRRDENKNRSSKDKKEYRREVKRYRSN